MSEFIEVKYETCINCESVLHLYLQQIMKIQYIYFF